MHLHKCLFVYTIAVVVLSSVLHGVAWAYLEKQGISPCDFMVYNYHFSNLTAYLAIVPPIVVLFCWSDKKTVDYEQYDIDMAPYVLARGTAEPAQQEEAPEPYTRDNVKVRAPSVIQRMAPTLRGSLPHDYQITPASVQGSPDLRRRSTASAPYLKTPTIVKGTVASDASAESTVAEPVNLGVTEPVEPCA